MKKKSWIIAIVGVLIIAVGAWLLYSNHQKQVDIEEHSAPLYNKSPKKGTAILSSDKDILNDYQENQFYGIAYGAIDSKVRDGLSDKLDDKSLYVEKVMGKGRYYIKYVAHWDMGIISQNFTTEVIVKLKTSDFRKSNTFKIDYFESDLTDFVNEYDPE